MSFLSGAPGRAGNLPRELSSFIGRQADIDDLALALRSSGLVTLVGPGGVGKTRLALKTAATVRHNYAHGAWLVELAALTDPSGVPAAVAAALGVRERPGSDPLTTLSQLLRGRQLLLVLDNCEHVLQRCTDLVSRLLQDSEDLTVLATSREPLGVGGETVRSVAPFEVPSPDASFERLVASDAVQLLLARVQAWDPTLALTQHSASVMASICRLLDGVPLGIELAAARARTMSLREIADRLDDPLNLLTRGPRAAPARHQTLRATIDWSYELLSQAERKLARRASIFSGGFTLDSARAVTGDAEDGPEDIADVLDRLVNHSFLSADTRREHARFRMLETIRQYCLERLEQSGEGLRVRERHRDWSLAQLSSASSEGLNWGHVAQIEPEMDNLRSALQWAVQTRQVTAATRLALGIVNFWHLRGSFAEGKATLLAVLGIAAPGEIPDELPHVATWAAILAANQGDYAEAEVSLRRAVRLAQTAGNAYAEVFAANQLGWLALLRGDASRARDINQTAYDQVTPDSRLAQLIRLQLALDYVALGDHDHAAELLDGLQESTRVQMFTGRMLHARALLAEQRSDYVEADRLLEQAIAMERALGDMPGLIESLTVRGVVAMARGARQLAAETLAEALRIAALYGSKGRLAPLLEALAHLVAGVEPAACVRLAAAAEQLRQALSAAPLPIEQARIGGFLETAKRRVGERVYASLWMEAQSVPLETTLDEAAELLRTLFNQAPEARGPATTDTLSDREREVAILVARGYSNRQIAAELVITPKTAETHVSHVLSKLGLTSRVQIATWGLRHDLLSLQA